MLELKSVRKSFSGVNVFEELSFNLEKGDRVGLTGGNGTGKSTLINLATGFLFCFFTERRVPRARVRELRHDRAGRAH